MICNLYYFPSNTLSNPPFLHPENRAMTNWVILQPLPWYLRLLLSSRWIWQRRSQLRIHSWWMLWVGPLEVVVIKVTLLQAQRPQYLHKLLHHRKGPLMKFLLLNSILFATCPCRISRRKFRAFQHINYIFKKYMYIIYTSLGPRFSWP